MSKSSVKVPDPKGRKTLGGTDGSSWDKGCSLAPLDCDKIKNSDELLGGVGGPIELVDGDGHCVESESGRMSLLNSAIIQSEFSKENEELSKWGKAVEEVDRSGPAGIVNCNKELRSCSEPKSLERLDVNVASCPRSGGSRS